MTAGSFSHRLPRDPSAPRLAVWRRLKRLGVAQLLDGLVALPADSRNREQLEWAAEQVTESGGQASIWLAEATTEAQSREVARSMSAAIGEQYREVETDALAATGAPSRERRTTLARLRMGLLSVASGGREARTRFRTLEEHGGRSLLEVQLETGRTHQIRVHLAAVHHPVVGDPVYGRAQRPLPPRQFLHAAHLEFRHPATGEWLTFDAPLPDDLASFLATWRNEGSR